MANPCASSVPLPPLPPGQRQEIRIAEPPSGAGQRYLNVRVIRDQATADAALHELAVYQFALPSTSSLRAWWPKRRC
jgi:evolved beta-galactosidase subunit alpha